MNAERILQVIRDVSNTYGAKEPPGVMLNENEQKRYYAFMPDRYDAAIREALEQLQREDLIRINYI